MNARALIALGVVLATLTACSSKDDDLDGFIAQTRKEPAGGVQGLPEVRPYESFAYQDRDLRSPFVPGGSGGSSANVRPDRNRNPEFLERFSLDSLKMVGTLGLAGHNYGLVQTKEGLVYRVQPGNHIGQNDGTVDAVTSSKISITEIVPDGLGGYTQRAASLALND